MEYPPQQTPEKSRTWILYLLLIIVVIGAVVARQVAVIISRSAERRTATASPATVLMSGDMYIKYGISRLPGANVASSAHKAIDSYSKAIPWPSAYRRIGIARQVLLKEPGLKDLQMLASPKATKGLEAADKAKLKSEAAMWRDIYGKPGLDRGKAGKYIDRIKDLNLGPLKQVAISDVYVRSMQPARAKAAMAVASSNARNSILGFGFLLIVLVLAGITGIGLIIFFSTTYLTDLVRKPRPMISSRTLITSFLAYLISYYVLGLLFGLALAASGVDTSSTRGVSISLLLDMLAMIGSWGLGLMVLRNLTQAAYEDPREIGMPVPAREAVKWGVGGYCASLPLILTATIISNTLFRNVPTPEHPIESVILRGGLPFGLAFFMAVILAPLVEETAFRGMLYTGLRAHMGVWPSALVSAAIFAIIHPTLPAGFLPIFALGTVFALLREKTNSLLPSMVAHGLNNAVQFIIMWLYT